MGHRRIISREANEFDRGLGFFDAVYGFAITLLVANIIFPPAREWKNVATLFAGGLGFALLGFTISFVVIAVFWYSNTNMLAQFKAFDGTIVAANLATTALVVIIPFTTQGISDPEISEFPLATALYATNIALTIVAQSVMYTIGLRRGLLRVEPSRETIVSGYCGSFYKVAVFLISIPVAYLVDPIWGRTLWLLILLTGPIEGFVYRKLGGRTDGSVAV